MAAPRKARGFTLVELLVVITIIGMLMALLLPAIQSAREAGRKNTCANNMRNNGFALYSVAETKRAFPGYSQLVTKPTGQVLVSWVVPILPLLERNDLFQNWQNAQLPLTLNVPPTTQQNILLRQQYISQISVLVCPSNPSPDLGDNPLSYVVNTGSAMSANDNSRLIYTSAPNWPEDGNSGVFFNHSQVDYLGSGQPLKKITLDFLNSNDGTSHTLMLSENLQATSWASDASAGGLTPFQSDFAVRLNTGMVWYITGNLNNANAPATPNMTSNYLGDAITINSYGKSVTGTPDVKWQSTPDPTKWGGLVYARPSSSHPGGVNAVFCDGHLSFLNEEIGYQVYTQLMTPLSKLAVVDYKTAGPPPTNPLRANSGTIGSPAATTGANKVMVPWTYTLNEADYQ